MSRHILCMGIINIRTFMKKGKGAVISIGGVDYLIGKQALSDIENGKESIELVRLYDLSSCEFDLREIQDILAEQGVSGHIAVPLYT